MELKFLDIFCKVVELKSFSKAAGALHLTQPTVSIHIKALEEEFSTKLLDRLGKKVIPTQAGEILYRYAKEISRLKDEARLALDQLSGRMRGRLLVGASTIPGEYILPEFLGPFKKDYPDVFPVLRIGDTEEIHAMVLDGEVDVGVVGSIIEDRNILSTEFLDDEMILVSAPAFRRTSIVREAVSGLPLLQREAGSGSRASLEASLRENGIEPGSLNIVAEIGSTQAVIQAVKSGLGVAFISRLAVKSDIQRGALREIKVKGLTIRRHFYIITHRLRADSPITKTFVQFLSEKR